MCVWIWWIKSFKSHHLQFLVTICFCVFTLYIFASIIMINSSRPACVNACLYMPAKQRQSRTVCRCSNRAVALIGPIIWAVTRSLPLPATVFLWSKFKWGRLAWCSLYRHAWQTEKRESCFGLGKLTILADLNLASRSTVQTFLLNWEKVWLVVTKLGQRSPDALEV